MHIYTYVATCRKLIISLTVREIFFESDLIKGVDNKLQTNRLQSFGEVNHFVQIPIRYCCVTQTQLSLHIDSTLDTSLTCFRYPCIDFITISRCKSHSQHGQCYLQCQKRVNLHTTLF